MPFTDVPFQHYSLKQKAVSFIGGTLLDSPVYTVRHGLLKGMKRKGGLGWLPELLAPAPTAEEEFFSKLDLSGMTVFDVGSFHGLTALWFAKTAKKVVCFEPNTQNRSRLLANLRLNHAENIAVCAEGLSDAVGFMKMSFDPLMMGGARVGDGQARSEEIFLTTLDREALDIQPNFLKIDVEGHEAAVLRGGMKFLLSNHPWLYIELHGETIVKKISNVCRIVSFLDAMGYREFYHVETQQNFGPGSFAPLDVCRGHLFVGGMP